MVLMQIFSHRTFSGYAEWKENKQPVEKWLSFEEMKEAIEVEKGIVIDVRNHKEIQRDGKFPTTKIVPREAILVLLWWKYLLKYI